MEKKYNLCIVFGFLVSMVSAQDVSTLKLAALHRELSHKENDTTTVHTLLDIGNWHLTASLRTAYPKSKDSATYYLDKAIAFSKQIKYPKGEGLGYLYHSQLAYESRKDQESSRYAELAAEKLICEDCSKYRAEAYILYADANMANPNADVINKALAAKEIYHNLGDKIKEGHAADHIAKVYLFAGNLEKSLQYAKEGLQIYTDAGYKGEGLVLILWSISDKYFQQGDMDAAFSYNIRATQLAESSFAGTSMAERCYSQLGKFYNFSQKYDEAALYYRKAYDIAKTYTSPTVIVVCTGNLIQALVDSQRVDEALVYLEQLKKRKDLNFDSKISVTARCISVYTQIKEYAKAEKYVTVAIDMIKNYPEHAFVKRILYRPVAEFYYTRGKYDLARKYYEQYKLWAEKQGNKPALKHIHSMLYKLDSIQNNYDSAIDNLKLSQIYKDSIFNNDSQKHIEELKVQYEVEKKEKDILLHEKSNKLLVKQNELQQERLLRSNQSRNLSIAGTGILIIFLGFLYRRHKANRRTNRMLQIQQAEITSSNAALKQLVDEKEWLLKEIHHRVKNNLHMIMSLLNSQSYFLEDEAALSAIQNSQHRIQSMSLIHQKLYMTDNLSSISMQNYINDLIEYLSDSFSNRMNVKFHVAVEDVEMDVSQAVPVGLILNEAITNSFKYAFPNGTGNISVYLSNTISDNFCLEIIDNGIGLPQAYDLQENKSLGMKLIKGLTEDLDGTLDIASSGKGTHIKITFAYRQMLYDKEM